MTFRHSILTHLLENGMGIRQIQEFAGHEKVGSTETYTKVTMVGLRRHFNRAVMNLLPRRLNGRTERTSRRDIAPHLTFREPKA